MIQSAWELVKLRSLRDNGVLWGVVKLAITAGQVSGISRSISPIYMTDLDSGFRRKDETRLLRTPPGSCGCLTPLVWIWDVVALAGLSLP